MEKTIVDSEVPVLLSDLTAVLIRNGYSIKSSRLVNNVVSFINKRTKTECDVIFMPYSGNIMYLTVDGNSAETELIERFIKDRTSVHGTGGKVFPISKYILSGSCEIGAPYNAIINSEYPLVIINDSERTLKGITAEQVIEHDSLKMEINSIEDILDMKLHNINISFYDKMKSYVYLSYRDGDGGVIKVGKYSAKNIEMTYNEFTEIVDKFLLAFIINYASEDVIYRSTFAGNIVAQMLQDMQDSYKENEFIFG